MKTLYPHVFSVFHNCNIENLHSEYLLKFIYCNIRENVIII